MNTDKFLVSRDATLRSALSLIENNNHGIILTFDSSNKVTGLVTDGDIRRYLLKEDTSLDDPISLCSNKDFLWEDPSTSRESLLKKLDHRIRVLPLLDKNGKLVDIVSRDYLPIQEEQAVFARAKSPVRISFGGGGSDLTHYFSADIGAVINTTVSIYSHATLRIRQDEEIVINSLDLKKSLTAKNLKDALKPQEKFGLIQALLKTISPDFGFELDVNSDFPIGSGLGGSAVVAAAILGCFNQFRQDRWDHHELAELAYQAERLYHGIEGGWQDQYATVFGGFNFMEFKMDQNVVHPLRIHDDILLELEESLILCNTGISHNSGSIHKNQRREMKQKDIKKHVQANVALCFEMRNQLLRGELLRFGKSLNQAWNNKKKLSSEISNNDLDLMYKNALKHGAIGGKLLGAGGGGFYIFYTPPSSKHELIEFLNKSKLEIRPFRFEKEGLRSWTVRESKN
ncbi:MAG: CBS domain-containing protein [Gammaproteobacteria bacterium]|nr:CBS domain-containing protein [Gammaproteobacteria bacterium]